MATSASRSLALSSLALTMALVVSLALAFVPVEQQQRGFMSSSEALFYRDTKHVPPQDLSVRLPHPRVSWIRSDGEMLLFNYGNVTASDKIAAFDYDSTLGIPPAWQQINNSWSAMGQSCSQTDWVLPNTRHIWWWAYRQWRFTFTTIPQVMRDLHNQGYKIVIMSNQYVLSFQFDVTEDYPPLQKKQDWVAKLYEMADAISEAAGQVIPIQVFGALYQDYYNKPCAGMWATAMAYNTPYNQINCSSSFYVGDADGRTSGTTTSPDGSDFSSGDFQYAISCGIGYKTPEQAFMNAPPPPSSTLNQCVRLPAYTWCDETVKKVWCKPGTAQLHKRFVRPV